MDLDPSDRAAIFFMELMAHAEVMAGRKPGSSHWYHPTLNASTTHVMHHADTPYADGPGAIIINYCTLGGLLVFIRRNEQVCRTVWIRAGDCYSFADDLRYEYTHAVLQQSPSMAELAPDNDASRSDIRCVFTIRLGKTTAKEDADFKTYWHSDDDSDGSEEAANKGDRSRVWEPSEYIPADDRESPMKPVSQFITKPRKDMQGAVTIIKPYTRFRTLVKATKYKPPILKEFHIVLTAMLPKGRSAFCRHAVVQHTPKSTWTWEQPIWIAAAHIVGYAFQDLVGDDLAQARQVDVSPEATFPHYISNPNRRLLSNSEACAPDYVPWAITIDSDTPSSTATNPASPPRRGRTRSNTRANVRTGAQPTGARSQRTVSPCASSVSDDASDSNGNEDAHDHDDDDDDDEHEFASARKKKKKTALKKQLARPSRTSKQAVQDAHDDDDDDDDDEHESARARKKTKQTASQTIAELRKQLQLAQQSLASKQARDNKTQMPADAVADKAHNTLAAHAIADAISKATATAHEVSAKHHELSLAALEKQLAHERNTSQAIKQALDKKTQMPADAVDHRPHHELAANVIADAITKATAAAHEVSARQVAAATAAQQQLVSTITAHTINRGSREETRRRQLWYKDDDSDFEDGWRSRGRRRSSRRSRSPGGRRDESRGRRRDESPGRRRDQSRGYRRVERTHRGGGGRRVDDDDGQHHAPAITHVPSQPSLPAPAIQHIPQPAQSMEQMMAMFMEMQRNTNEQLKQMMARLSHNKN